MLEPHALVLYLEFSVQISCSNACETTLRTCFTKDDKIKDLSAYRGTTGYLPSCTSALPSYRINGIPSEKKPLVSNLSTTRGFFSLIPSGGSQISVINKGGGGFAKGFFLLEYH